MGLDAKVGKYGSDDYISFRLGSYSGYMYWRKAIAKALGFNLDEMQGYCKNGITWTDEPCQSIFNHSDCDGEYTVEQIPDLMKEIDIIKTLNVDDYDQCYKFVRLCAASLELNRPIEFL